MTAESVQATEWRALSYERRSKVRWFDFEEQLRSAGASPENIELLSRHIGSGNFFRPPGFESMKPLSIDFSFLKFNPISIKLMMDLYNEMLASPYTVNFENGLDLAVQFVWSYELWSGLILVDQTTYIQPGQTGTVQYAHCLDMRQYAFSTWDEDDNELGRSPTWTVAYINQIEAKKGTFKACTDTIEVS